MTSAPGTSLAITLSTDCFWPIAVSRDHAGVGRGLPIGPDLFPMTQSVRAIAKCQDPGDGSGDVIIDLPPDVLAVINVDLGDSLSIELVNGAIVLKPIRDANTQS